MSGRVLTANHLVSGEVVFLAPGEAWTATIDEALVIASDEEAANAEAVGARDAAARIVVDVYLIDVEREAGRIVPVRLREKIRTKGPTVRPDLGKQAAAPGSASEERI